VTKTMNAKSAEIAMCKISIGSEPSDQVLIGGLLFSLTVNSLVWNLLAKQTHDCKLVVDQLAFRLPGQLSSFCLRSWEVETPCSCV
jgi:hypothetical protein